MAVLAYHAGFGWMTGGFYGVEVFFVVSGFLITSLLLDERERSGRIALGTFWARRARRLLPALCAMLVAVAAWTSVAGSAEQQGQLRRDLPWGAFYVANWGQIVGKVPYYSSTDPPLLRHLWSLAVEEQWYLIWPLVFAGLAALGLSMTRRAALLAAGFAVIWLGMVVISWGSLSGTFHAPLLGDVDRTNLLYLSSVTRAGGLLLGAAAAFVWRPWRWRPPARPLTGLECAGAASLTILVIAFCTAHLASAATFQWTLPLVSLASLVVVCVAVHPGAPTMRRLLGSRPLVELGKRSYGIYLWHWPIFVLVGVQAGGRWRVGVALVLTALTSEACYQFIETPIRNGTWRATYAALRHRLAPSLATMTMIVALPVLLLGGLFVHYSSIKPFDRAAGGDDVAFAAPPSPTTAPNGGAEPDDPTAGLLKVTVVGDSMAHALVINRPKALASTMKLSDGAIEGCDVFDSGSAVSSTGFTLGLGQCKGWADRWARSVAKNGADVALVVTGAWDVLDVHRVGRHDADVRDPGLRRRLPRPAAARHRRRRRDRRQGGLPGGRLHATRVGQGGGHAATARAGRRRSRRAPLEADPHRGVAQPVDDGVHRRTGGVVQRLTDRHRPRLPLGRRPRLQARRGADLHDDRAAARSARYATISVTRGALARRWATASLTARRCALVHSRRRPRAR